MREHQAYLPAVFSTIKRPPMQLNLSVASGGLATAYCQLSTTLPDCPVCMTSNPFSNSV